MALGCFIGNIRGYRYDDGDQDLHDEVDSNPSSRIGEQEITLPQYRSFASFSLKGRNLSPTDC